MKLTPEYQRAWRKANHERALAHGLRYREAHRAERRVSALLYRTTHSDQRAEAGLRYRASDRYDREKMRVYQRDWQRTQRACNPVARIRARLQTRLRSAITGRAGKAAALQVLVGCSFEELKSHLEGLFQPGMSWERIQEIHIDHIRPLASFDLTDPEQQHTSFHYTNLQPLWAADNRRKSKKYLPELMERLPKAVAQAFEEFGEKAVA